MKSRRLLHHKFNPTHAIQISTRVNLSHSTQLKFMYGHIIHEEESKLVRWGVTQSKESSQNIKGGLHKDLHKIYTRIYTRSYMSIYTTFEVLRLKTASEGKHVQMGVTKPSATSTKELQNHQRGSINKWHPPKHHGGPLNHKLGSIILT